MLEKLIEFGNVGGRFCFKPTDDDERHAGVLVRSGESFGSVLSLVLICIFGWLLANGVQRATRKFNVTNPLDVDNGLLLPLVSWLGLCLVSIYVGGWVGKFLSPLRYRFRFETNDGDLVVKQSAIARLGANHFNARFGDGSRVGTVVEQLKAQRILTYDRGGSIRVLITRQGDKPNRRTLAEANRYSASQVTTTAFKVFARMIVGLVVHCLNPIPTFSLRKPPDLTEELRIWLLPPKSSAVTEVGRFGRFYHKGELMNVAVALRNLSVDDRNLIFAAISVLFVDQRFQPEH